MSASCTRVLIADDHALLREMLQARLDVEPDFRVVAAAATGDEALATARAEACDLLVMDIDMPGLSAFEVIRQLGVEASAMRAVLLSAFVTDAYVQRALEVGASGYLTKTESPDALVVAIRRVARGFTCYAPAVRARLVVDAEGVRLRPVGGSRAASLTAREREVLLHLAQGSSKKETARALDISLKTVDHHAEHLMLKLDIHDRVDLTRFAIREGMMRA